MKKRDWDEVNQQRENIQVPYTPGVEVIVEPIDQPLPESTPATTDESKKQIGSHWEVCEECGEQVWLEMGKEYHHRLHCSKTNGIAYPKDRSGTTTKHAPGCVCMMCQSARSK